MKRMDYVFLWPLRMFIICCVSSYAFASPSSDLAHLLAKVNTIEATFSQTIYDNRNQPVQRSFGKMAMERPDKFRWEVKKPIPQLIIANQSRLFIYDPDLEQVTIRPFKQTVGETPSMLLSYNTATLEKEYRVVILPKKSSDLRWFALSPKNPDNAFVGVQLGFANDIINQMKLQDHLGNTTRIQFENIKTNKPLATNLFTFKTPKGVDVIDETKGS